jgi:hypothetical protein
MWSSTRRLFCRPCAVSFVSIGLSGPWPTLVSRSAAIPCETSHFTTIAVRSALSFLLRFAEPVLSVCPSTRTFFISGC